MRELRTLAAMTGGEGDRRRDRRRSQLRKLVEALAAGGQLRAHWSIDEASDALAVLTSYATYERLRREPRTAPEQVEAVLAKLAIAIVAPGGTPRARLVSLRPHRPRSGG